MNRPSAGETTGFVGITDQAFEAVPITAGRQPPFACVHELFTRQAHGTPEAIALVHEDQNVTYGELDARANQVANFLRERQVMPDDLVGLFMQRSVEMIVGLLGIMKAGAGYVPLDPTYPSERLAHMITDADLPVLLVQGALTTLLPGQKAQVISLDTDWPSIARHPRTAPRAAVTEENVAYVIYTSGSTGKPKGVVIPHRALSNHMLWMQGAYPLDATDVVLQKTPFSFDASIWEILSPLLAGAKLVLAKPEGHKDPVYLCEMIRRHGVTTLQLVPSMLRVFLDDPNVTACTSLRNVFSGGEALTAEVRDKLFGKLKANLHNLYGPTETCIQSVVYSCSRDQVRNGINVPIGRPISNTQGYVVDEQLEPVADGMPGELLIGGACLARGYLGRAELTAERFVRGPGGARVYRTGDQVRRLPDGNLEFLGRIDHQVKLRGYRIELEEIEAVLRTHNTVRDAVVTARQDGRGESHLTGYVVGVPGATPVTAELRDHLRQRLPENTDVPTFVMLGALPLLPNGKVNRSALPMPEPAAVSGDGILPRSPFEKDLARIWSDILKRERVGINDDFFDLGGTSLDLVSMFGRACEHFGTAVDIGVVSQGATIASLAHVFEEAKQN